MDRHIEDLHDCTVKRDHAGTIAGLRSLHAAHPNTWTDLLVQLKERLNDEEGRWLMSHVVLREGNRVTFEWREHGAS